jgi:hypothetical protein
MATRTKMMKTENYLCKQMKKMKEADEKEEG